MSRSRSFILRYFECSSCQLKASATKSPGRGTSKDHMKTMYCPRCDKRRRFVQTGSDYVKAF